MSQSLDIVKQHVVDQLFSDARIDASGISVELVGSTVILSGYVPTFYAKQAAEQDAWSIRGVSEVRNEIHIRSTENTLHPSDFELTSMIKKILSWHKDIDISDVEISITSGTVTLDGTIPAYWQKIRIEELIYQMSTLAVIHNRLSVVPARHYVDELIARDISAAIDRNKDLNISTIDIQVDNGIVILSGTVPSRNCQKVIQQLALQTDGVIDVINNCTLF
jgi:osmotically-inducible protein OsmY